MITDATGGPDDGRHMDTLRLGFGVEALTLDHAYEDEKGFGLIFRLDGTDLPVIDARFDTGARRAGGGFQVNLAHLSLDPMSALRGASTFSVRWSRLTTLALSNPPDGYASLLASPRRWADIVRATIDDNLGSGHAARLHILSLAANAIAQARSVRAPRAYALLLPARPRAWPRLRPPEDDLRRRILEPILGDRILYKLGRSAITPLKYIGTKAELSSAHIRMATLAELDRHLRDFVPTEADDILRAVADLGDSDAPP